MRHLKKIAVASSLVLAGTATQNGFNGLEPRFLTDDLAYRVECDNDMTVRPTDAAYWAKMSKATLSLAEAISSAELAMTENMEYDEAKTLSAELILIGNPYYRLEVFTRKNTSAGELVTHRWKVQVGMRGKIKNMVRQERLPGTPVRGDIVTMPSGIMVHDVREGDGQEVRADSNVRIHCMVTRLDGAIIQSTYDERAPMDFNLATPPIEGLKELVGSRVGGKRKLVIPPDKAFGKEGRADLVPPFATLVYDIEILRVN